MSVDFEEKFKALGWKYKTYSKGFLVSCPNKQWHKNGDSHFSCVVWPEINWFRCYGCGKQGQLPQLFDGTGQELSDFWSLDVKFEREDPENPILDEDILDCFRPATPIDLKRMNREYPNRDWGQEHIDRFDLRFDERHNNVVFPVRSPHLVGAVGRNIHKKVVHNYFGCLMGTTLGGLNLAGLGKTILLVEGWTCLVNCHQWASDRGYDVLCTFTANCSPRQAEMLGDTLKPVVVAFDQDPAGNKGAEKLGDLLDGTTFRRVWHASRGDIGGMDKETFLKVLG